MATKRFIIELEEGHTPCEECPIIPRKEDCKVDLFYLQCQYYNLAKIRIQEIKCDKL